MLLDKATILKKMLEADLIDKSDVSEAVSKCKKHNQDLYEYIVSRLNKKPNKIREFILANFNCPSITLNDIVLNPRIVNIVPPNLVVNHLMIPAFQINQRIFLAVSDPLDIDGINEVMKYTGEKTDILLSTKEHILKAISEYIFKPIVASVMAQQV